MRIPVIRLRLARIGGKHDPTHALVAINKLRARDGKPLDHLGFFSPIADADGVKHFVFDGERVRYWLARGAIPSTPVATLLGNANIIPAAPPKYIEPTAPVSPAAARVMRKAKRAAKLEELAKDKEQAQASRGESA